MDSAKRAQEVSQRLPQAFNRVDVDFTDTVAVVVARPFFRAVTDRLVTPIQLGVALPLVAVTGRAIPGELLDVAVQRLFVGALGDSQAALATTSSNRPDHRRAVIVVRAMSALLIGSATRRIRLVYMPFAFFPPRSETSRLFPSGGRATASRLTSRSRSLGAACARCEHFAEISRVLQPRPESFRLYTRRAPARPLGADSSCCHKRWCHYTNCKACHTPDSDNRRVRVLCDETRGLDPSEQRNADSEGLSDENVFQSKWCWPRRLTTWLSGKSCPDSITHRFFT